MSETYLTASPSLSLNDLRAMKQRGEKISSLTCYDASFASLLDRCGIDVLLVGDSLGMVLQGHRTTVPVSVDDMIYHTACVSRARHRAWVIADMPFASYGDEAQALANAARLVQVGGADMIKLEGAKPSIIRHLAEQGIAVCGHLGLLPQSIQRLGSYSVQGRQSEQAQQILAQALALEAAGAELLVLECIPEQLAQSISEQLRIPVIGIGAGVACDGQVLVLYDMLGISPGKRPRFSKNFLDGQGSIEAAVTTYQHAVKSAQFPAAEHSYS